MLKKETEEDDSIESSCSTYRWLLAFAILSFYPQANLTLAGYSRDSLSLCRANLTLAGYSRDSLSLCRERGTSDYGMSMR